MKEHTFKQLIRLQHTLRNIMSEELITCPGLNHFEEEAGVLNDADA